MLIKQNAAKYFKKRNYCKPRHIRYRRGLLVDLHTGCVYLKVQVPSVTVRVQHLASKILGCVKLGVYAKMGTLTLVVVVVVVDSYEYCQMLCSRNVSCMSFLWNSLFRILQKNSDVSKTNVRPAFWHYQW